jgi:hypothetical protein
VCSSRACEPGEHLDCLPEQPDSCLAALDQAEHVQGGADGVRVTPPSSEREFFLGERTRFVVSVESSEAFGGPAAPEHAAWIVVGEQPSGLANLEQLLDSPLGASGLDPQTAADEPKPDEVNLIDRELLWEVTLGDDSRRLVRVPLLQQRKGQEPDVVGPGDAHAVGDAEIDRFPQIRDRGSKIAAIRLRLAAPHQHECDVEDVAAPASPSDCLVEDGNRIVEQPRPVERDHRVIERERAARLQVAGRERAPGELDRALAAQPQPVLVIRHRPKQDLAAEAAAERIEIELLDPCFGDGVGLRVRPGGADQLRQEQLVEVRIALPIDLAKGLLEDCKGIPGPVREPKRAAELERDRAAPRPVGEELETGAQVVGRSRAVRPPLRKAELNKHLRPRSRIHVLGERAAQKSDRGLGRALGERALGRLAERRDHERVGLWGHAEEVRRRTLSWYAVLLQELSGQAVRSVSFNHIERLVDGPADDGVEELERILAQEEVKPNEGRGGRTKLACPHAGERGRVAQFRPVAEDRRRAEEGKRLRRQASEAKPDVASNTLRSDLWQTVHVLGGRAGSLACNRLEHRADEERISASRRFEGGAEGLVRLQTVQLTREHGDRGAAKRLRANRGGLRIGDELSDECGIVALALGRPRPRGHEERHALEPARQVEEPAERGGVRPVQVVDREQRRP